MTVFLYYLELVFVTENFVRKFLLLPAVLKRTLSAVNTARQAKWSECTEMGERPEVDIGFLNRIGPPRTTERNRVVEERHFDATNQ